MEEQRQRFLQRAILKTLPKNDIVFFEGDTGDSCFYVASGLVRIFSITDSGKESIFFLRRPGELFGLSEVLNAFPRRANAQTLMPTELYAMPSVEFDSLLAEDYVLARRVITMLGSRVRYLGDRLSNLATGSVMSRLIKLLISLVYDLLPDAEAWAKPRRTSGPHLPGTARLHDRLNAAHSQRPAPEVAQSWPDSHRPPPNHDMQPAPPARPRRRNHRGLNTARKGWTGTLIHHDRFGQGRSHPHIQCALALLSIGGLLM